jgi:hypothetical protein
LGVSTGFFFGSLIFFCGIFGASAGGGSGSMLETDTGGDKTDTGIDSTTLAGVLGNVTSDETCSA